MEGSGCIRPWQCSWRSDFGISGMVDPEQAECLMELYVLEGLLNEENNSGDDVNAAEKT